MNTPTKIHRVLAAIGDSSTVSEIEQATSFDQDYIRNALLILRARKHVTRVNEGRPNCEAGIFAITPAGLDVLAGAEFDEPMPPVSMVAHALSQRHVLATVWAGA